MRTRGTLVVLIAPLVLLVGLLGGCGDDSDSTADDPAGADSSSTSTPSDSTDPSESTEPSESASPDWADCTETWVAGQRLPNGYKGCLDSGDPVKADSLMCSSGQRLVRYDDSFYAVAGGTISETSGPLDKDKGYLKTIRTCRG